MPYLLFLKKQHSFTLPSAANYRWRFKGYFDISADPLIIESPINQGVEIGGNATLTCTVEGLPKPTQFWRRQDGKKLDFGGRVRHQPSGQLFIRGKCDDVL